MKKGFKLIRNIVAVILVIVAFFVTGFLILDYPLDYQKAYVSIYKVNKLSAEELKEFTYDYEKSLSIRNHSEDSNYLPVRITVSITNGGKTNPYAVSRAKIKIKGKRIIYNRKKNNICPVAILNIDKAHSEWADIVILIKDSNNKLKKMSNDELINYLNKNTKFRLYGPMLQKILKE